MNYSNNPALVRIDFFKPSGKWYDTDAFDMSGEYKSPSVHDAVINAIRKHPHYAKRLTRDMDWTIVCLEPYHQYSHPILIKAGGYRAQNL